MTIGGHHIGGAASCYVVAEVGVNHNGDVGLAHRLVDVAAKAGADAVKFQTFDPAALVSTHAATAPYQNSATGLVTQRQMLDALVLPQGAWAELSEHATSVGLRFLSTAFDLRSADLIVGLGVPALKVPSGELTNVPFVRALAQMGLPLLMSTGMGSLDEVAAAVDAAAAAPGVALFHCLSAYPAPEEECNLRAIDTLRATFRVPVGWSDHTIGAMSAVIAVALGAALLEKHITLDRTLEGPDHAASQDPDAFTAYVADVRQTESMLGDGQKRPQPSETGNRKAGRRSWHATRELVRSETITEQDVIALRPETGVSPAVPLIGWRVRRTVPAGGAITFADVDPPAD